MDTLPIDLLAFLCPSLTYLTGAKNVSNKRCEEDCSGKIRCIINKLTSVILKLFVREENVPITRWGSGVL
jgi:hypothetical protein